MSDEYEVELPRRARRRFDELIEAVQESVCRDFRLVRSQGVVSWEQLGPDALRLVLQRALDESREAIRVSRFKDAKDYVAVSDFIDDVLANRLIEAIRDS
ncbi:hypothetical protein GCM10025864_18950 [Luteimicrobium album]|uniref:Uncharacterized protein n=1 Tax=Luteimicrobium album TaxID=1054550 RepID=A0ABQ6I1L8_9MICO|nr:hypothetical protein [Luteimicrobium album]GMA24136.1 hypothetical protein GCM10025864_18950 [Luteimicrobium album]